MLKELFKEYQKTKDHTILQVCNDYLEESGAKLLKRISIIGRHCDYDYGVLEIIFRDDVKDLEISRDIKKYVRASKGLISEEIGNIVFLPIFENYSLEVEQDTLQPPNGETFEHVEPMPIVDPFPPPVNRELIDHNFSIISDFTSVDLPTIKKAFTNMVAHDIVSVQPMSIPAELFYFDFSCFSAIFLYYDLLKMKFFKIDYEYPQSTFHEINEINVGDLKEILNKDYENLSITNYNEKIFGSR